MLKSHFLQESNLQDRSKITNQENSVEPSPPTQQLIFFLQKRPGTPGACCCTCCSTVPAVGASTVSNAACSPSRDAGSLAPEPQGDSGVSHNPHAQPGAEVSVPVALTHFTPASLCCSAPEKHNRRDRDEDKTQIPGERDVCSHCQTPLLHQHQGTRMHSQISSLTRQGRLSQRSQEVRAWHCYSVLGPEFPFGNLTGLLFTALTLKFGKWVHLKRFKIYFKMAIKAMLGMNVNMQ